MADKYANGLLLTAPTASQCGRTFARWLVEWLTQICGWTLHDAYVGTAWSNVVSSGTDGAEDPTETTYQKWLFKSVSAVFSSSDVGAYLTITGFSKAEWNGIYRINQVVSATTVKLDIWDSVHHRGILPGATGLTWRLWRPTNTYCPVANDIAVVKGTGTTSGGPSGYSFHTHIKVRSSNSYFPELIMSPFASWVVSTGWSDAKRTTALGIDNWSNSLINVDNCRVWAAADKDRAVIFIRPEDDYYSYHFLYIGEINTYHTAEDPKPCILWEGSNAGSTTPGGDAVTLIGTGASSNLNGRGYWLGYDDLTTVAGNMTFMHCSPAADLHWMAEWRRQFSMYNKDNYLLDAVCESKTTGHMELRGALRRTWITGRDNPRLNVFGANGEYVHVIGGLTMPWHGSQIRYER